MSFYVSMKNQDSAKFEISIILRILKSYKNRVKKNDKNIQLNLNLIVLAIDYRKIKS